MLYLLSWSKVVTEDISICQSCLECHLLLSVNNTRDIAQTCNGFGRVWEMEYLYRKSVYLVAKK
jgi:hypothetical protein